MYHDIVLIRNKTIAVSPSEDARADTLHYYLHRLFCSHLLHSLHNKGKFAPIMTSRQSFKWYRILQVSLGGHDSPPLPTESATHHNSPPPGPSLSTGGIRKRHKLPKASVARGPSPSTSSKSHSLELQGVAPTVDTASHSSMGVWNNW